jgi:hypothetical protein
MSDLDITAFRIQNAKDWKLLIDKLFPMGLPTHARWEDEASIINVLNHLGSVKNVNHLFFPSGGGLDLTGAQLSTEEGLIELEFGGSRRACKVASLTFESFSDEEDYQWNYFRIDTVPMSGTGTYDLKADAIQEELTEIYPGEYASRSAWDNREYRGEPLPATARLVTRILNGSMVIFQKTSLYNRVPDTYSAPHNQTDAEGMRTDIIGLKQRIEQALAARA